MLFLLLHGALSRQHFEDFEKKAVSNFEEIEKNLIKNFEETGASCLVVGVSGPIHYDVVSETKHIEMIEVLSSTICQIIRRNPVSL